MRIEITPIAFDKYDVVSVLTDNIEFIIGEIKQFENNWQLKIFNKKNNFILNFNLLSEAFGYIQSLNAMYNMQNELFIATSQALKMIKHGEKKVYIVFYIEKFEVLSQAEMLDMRILLEDNIIQIVNIYHKSVFNSILN